MDIKDDIPYINIELNLQASIVTLEDNIDYGDNATLQKFSESAKTYLESKYSDYFKKLQDYDIDIDAFSNKALSYFSTNQEWEDFNWHEKFKTANFNVTTNINVTSSTLITRT